TAGFPPNGGDTNGNHKLDPQETWHFKCVATFNNVAGAMTNMAFGHGCFPSGSVTKDVTASGATAASCATGGKFVDDDETDSNTVTITAPTVKLGKSSCP